MQEEEESTKAFARADDFEPGQSEQRLRGATHQLLLLLLNSPDRWRPPPDATAPGAESHSAGSAILLGTAEAGARWFAA